MSENEEFDFPSSSLDEDTTKRSDRIQTLRIRWHEATDVILSQSSSPSSSSPSSCKQRYADFLKSWFDRIIEMHTEKERSYHTLCHLEEMFGFIDLIMTHETSSISLQRTESGNDKDEDDINNSKTMLRAAVELAVFFHDCVYNAKSSSNEEDSAQLFMQFVEELLNFPQQQSSGNQNKSASASEKELNAPNINVTWEGTKIVHEFIMATKSHNIESESESDDQRRMEQLRYLKIFLDSDMAVLGKQPSAYDHYATLIRREYAHVEHDVYCEKRAEILDSFIGSVVTINSDAKKYIYLTTSMRDALEGMAVENLKREIVSLQKGVIPGG